MEKDNIVLLVDNRKRDLLGAALIAHHLKRLGITCFLEPLEAYKAVLAVHKPAMIIFNHLLASHLVRYSKRLKKLGVLTAVLPNEAFVYNREVLRFNAGRFHNEAHIDYYFCWNGELKSALLETGFQESITRLPVIGVPRYDYYYPPWSQLFEPLAQPAPGKKRILLCTNFALVRFSTLPKSAADQFYAAWAPRIAAYSDYWGCIQSVRKRRDAMPDYIMALVETGKYEVIIRPHPTESIAFYKTWLDTLPDNLRADIRIDAKSNIAQLMVASDVTLAVETCATTLESWIAGKPSINLIFDRHPMLYDEAFVRLNPLCDSPQALPKMVAQALAEPNQASFAAARQAHLSQWCGYLDGDACQRMAHLIRDALLEKKPCDWSQLTLDDHRRASKLRFKSWLNLPYTFDAALLIKQQLFPKEYFVRGETVKKTIRKSDVRNIMKKIALLDPPA